uniref:fimbrial protein n=1 Tax=Castellaniella defragrans TaxID=75697 RepID=UPI0033429D17
MRFLRVVASLLAGIGILISMQVEVAAATLTFTGNITTSSCKLAGGVTQKEVPLSPVHVNQFNGVGSTTGFKDFDIDLENCPVQYNKVKIYFYSCTGPFAYIGAEGTCTRTSTTVNVQLRNADDTVIRIGTEADARSFSINPNGTVSASYKVGYYAGAYPVVPNGADYTITAELKYEN